MPPRLLAPMPRPRPAATPRAPVRATAVAVLAVLLAACTAPRPAALEARAGEARPSDVRAGDGRSRHGAERGFQGKALALAIAAEQGRADVVRRLMVEDKVDPDTVFSREDGLPLVAWPVVAGNAEGLRALLDNGADPDARRPEAVDKRVPDGSGGRYPQYENALVLAAQSPDPAYLRLLLAHGGNPDTRNRNNEPLTYVAFLARNQWANVRLLIEGGADIEGASWSGRPIDWYSRRGGFEQTYWLLQRGADPNRVLRGAGGAPDYMPVVADIYWHPGSPDTVAWQRKCQHWLRDKGIARPPMPQHLRDMRRAFKFPHEEGDIPLL